MTARRSMIVEPDRTLVTTLARQLAARGYTVVDTADGEVSSLPTGNDFRLEGKCDPQLVYSVRLR